MKKFNEENIIKVLQEAEGDSPERVPSTASELVCDIPGRACLRKWKLMSGDDSAGVIAIRMFRRPMKS